MMNPTHVGFIGWRGMVGSVLMNRLKAENDFQYFTPTFFSTSAAGSPAPLGAGSLEDAYDLNSLLKMDIILTTQGSQYTRIVYSSLRQQGWEGFWIDAASTLRMEPEALIVLDPLNRNSIDTALTTGLKTFVGGNCTVSCMLLALGGLFEAKKIEWVNSMTYQAASGGGAKHMRELLTQFGEIHQKISDQLYDPAKTILDIDQRVSHVQKNLFAPEFEVPLAGNLIPWIDADLNNGYSREEWKACSETNKILATQEPISIDGLCVRIGAMRSHSQALTFKLTEELSIDDIEELLTNHNSWVHFVPNTKESSIKALTPMAVSGTLTIAVGRLRKTRLEPRIYTAFTVGDQLLWGAAEPLRRMLLIILGKL